MLARVLLRDLEPVFEKIAASPNGLRYAKHWRLLQVLFDLDDGAPPAVASQTTVTKEAPHDVGYPRPEPSGDQ
jgi:hypothetical protein